MICIGDSNRMQSNPLDPIVIAGNAVAATLGAVVGVPISSAVADAMGAYAVIVVMAAIGASWALGDRSQTSRVSAFFYFIRVTATAAFLTVVLSDLAGKWLSLESGRILLIPVAFGLGMVGDNWRKVREWLVGVVQRVVNSKTGGGAQ